jgi:hypothetical protein
MHRRHIGRLHAAKIVQRVIRNLVVLDVARHRSTSGKAGKLYLRL